MTLDQALMLWKGSMNSLLSGTVTFRLMDIES
jgi:hypothetical protein